MQVTMPWKSFFSMSFKKSPSACLEGKPLTASDFAFDHYQMIQESIKRIQGRLTGIQPSSIC